MLLHVITDSGRKRGKERRPFVQTAQQKRRERECDWTTANYANRRNSTLVNDCEEVGATF
jgi:hypothetical protein